MFGVEQQRLLHLEGRWLPSVKKRTKKLLQCQGPWRGIQDEIAGDVRKASVFLKRALLPFYRKGKWSVREGLFLHTWVPRARSREVRLRRPLMALSTCSCRVSGGWEELANRAWPRRMASESRARPCQTSKACCST